MDRDDALRVADQLVEGGFVVTMNTAERLTPGDYDHFPSPSSNTTAINTEAQSPLRAKALTTILKARDAAKRAPELMISPQEDGSFKITYL